MNRIEHAFTNGKVLIGYFTAGDPSLDKISELICAMNDSGADIIEIGIPFSDPTAEGEVIYKANMRALDNGITVDDILNSIANAREKSDAVIVLLSYINPIFTYGYEKFFLNCMLAGVSGIVIPDLPFEERSEIEHFAKKYNISIISLVAPTSKSRIEKLVKESEGFVYLVSSLGVTGVRSNINGDLKQNIDLIKKYTTTPVAVGFGVSGPEQAKEISKICDGVIVGSAIVKIIEEYGENSVPYVAEFVNKLKTSMNGQ